MAYIDKKPHRETIMGVSRYDKNADQLCQIIKHLRQNKHFNDNQAENWRQNMLTMLQTCLMLNDQLGEMDGKGLI